MAAGETLTSPYQALDVPVCLTSPGYIWGPLSSLVTLGVAGFHGDISDLNCSMFIWSNDPSPLSVKQLTNKWISNSNQFYFQCFVFCFCFCFCKNVALGYLGHFFFNRNRTKCSGPNLRVTCSVCGVLISQHAAFHLCSQFTFFANVLPPQLIKCIY